MFSIFKWNWKGVSKSVLLLLASFSLSACVIQATPQRYYFNEGEAPSFFTGDLDGLSGDIKIKIDNNTVLQGKLASFSESLDLKGSYKQYEVNAECKMVYCTNSFSCFTYIDQQPAALLEFGAP